MRIAKMKRADRARHREGMSGQDNIFDSTAKEYARIVPACRFCQFLTLIYELDLEGDERILDVGCGPGVLSVEIAKKLRAGHITGLDLSENMIALAEGLARDHLLDNVRFEKGDALKLQFPPESFDVVISTAVLPWVHDPRRFLLELHRVLKKGGKLGLISLGPEIYREFMHAFETVMKRHPQYFPDDSPGSYLQAKIYSDDELESELKAIGFKVKKRFVLSLEEPVTPESYLKRINAITGETHLRGVPEEKRETIRGDLKEILSGNREELKATECSVFVIAVKI
jgi:ubiquinone/menaquinone biosynthesis C-methylase UbiE